VTHALQRRVDAATLGLLLVAAEAAVRLTTGHPYPGATAVLVLACGIAMIPLAPAEFDRVLFRVAAVPSMGIVAFAVILTTISVAGAPLTDVSIRVAVVAFVCACAILARTTAVRGTARLRGITRAEWAAAAALAVVLCFALASAWDVVGPFPPGGVDWGHYLLYADEVEVERALLIDDRYSGEDGRLFADSPGVGALYGGVRILDGTPSEWLTNGIVLVSALTVLSVFLATGVVWGLRAGVLAAAIWAVSPIHIDPIRWHGVGTNLALIFVPLVVLGLALLFRGSRNWRILVFLGAALLGVAVTHSTSTFVIGFVVAAALILDLARQAINNGVEIAAWWRDGILWPLLGALGVACVAGLGVLVHLRAQASDLGSPVGFEHFEPDWLSWEVVVEYYSLVYLVLAGAGVVVVLATRELRRDPAMLALVAAGAACVIVAELWRLEIPFEYRRAVLYAGVTIAILIGAASIRLGSGPVWVLGTVAALALLAHHSVGLRLPERLLEAEAKGTAAQTIRTFGSSLEDDLEGRAVVVADRCHNFIVPYLLRRPTLVAYEPWQVGFESRVALASRAQAILDGSPAGRRIAKSLGVRYVVANPACTPGLPERLGGSVVVQTSDVVIVDIRASKP